MGKKIVVINYEEINTKKIAMYECTGYQIDYTQETVMFFVVVDGLPDTATWSLNGCKFEIYDYFDINCVGVKL